MTTPDLAAIRIRVAEAMGWKDIRNYAGAMPFGIRNGDEEFVPNFASPDWSATGAVLDEIERRGWGCHTSKFRARLSSTHDCSITTDDGCIEETNPCRHLAICLAFLAAHDRAKEPK